MEAWRQSDDIFKVQKESNCQPKILYSAKLSLKNIDETRHSQINKNDSFVTVRPAIQEIPNGILQPEMKGHRAVP